jgi:hypothetical protein
MVHRLDGYDEIARGKLAAMVKAAEQLRADAV